MTTKPRGGGALVVMTTKKRAFFFSGIEMMMMKMMMVIMIEIINHHHHLSLLLSLTLSRIMSHSLSLSFSSPCTFISSLSCTLFEQPYRSGPCKKTTYLKSSGNCSSDYPILLHGKGLIITATFNSTKGSRCGSI